MNTLIQRRLWCGLLVGLSGLAQAANIGIVYDTDTDCSDGKCDFQSALDFAAGSPGPDTLTLPSTDVLIDGVFITDTPFAYACDEDQNDARDDDCDITITGAGRTSTVLSGGGTSPVLRIGTTGGSRVDPVAVTISDLAVRDGTFGPGQVSSLQVVTLYGDVELIDTAFYRNTGGFGSARLSTTEFGAGSVRIIDSTFHDNQSPALYVDFQSVELTTNVFENNRGCRSAAVQSGFGPVTITGNYFTGNSSAPFTECLGVGLHLNAGGIRETVIEGNEFRQNVAGSGSSGAGAYVNRVDGAVRLERNTFFENVIGGAELDGVGAGLWLSLAGSFAEGEVLGNVFLNNNARRLGNAAWIYSLDTPVLFASNTVNYNRPNEATDPGSVAVWFDAPGIEVRNNIFWQNAFVGGNDVLLVERANIAVPQATLITNMRSSFDVPDDADLTDVLNSDEDPLLAAYPDFHIADRDSPAIDTGADYDESPAVDIDAEDRRVDGDGSVSVLVMDRGADEFGQSATLTPIQSHMTANEDIDRGAISDQTSFSLLNTGADELVIAGVRLETTDPNWELIPPPALPITVDPGTFYPGVATVRFNAIDREDSSNRLVVETSIGTFESGLDGEFRRLPSHDFDNVPDIEESGPYGTFVVYQDGDLTESGWDGNCDGVPDQEQSNVASLFTQPQDLNDPEPIGEYITIVAPRQDQQIGTGDFIVPPLEPLLFDVRSVPALDEGGGPTGRNYPYGFLSFQVTAIGATAGAGLPVSIILPEDGPSVNGYVKNGPTPEEGWYRNRPPGGVGVYDFVTGEGSITTGIGDSSIDHRALNMNFSPNWVGARFEEVRGDFPVFFRDGSGDPTSGEWECDRSTRTVIHLRLKDGRLGDHDMGSNPNFVLDPGGPAVLPFSDADGDGVSDAEDNCPATSNSGQEDMDDDGAGDACDVCFVDPDKTEPGTCGCGVPDTDSDDDGVADCLDMCPIDPDKSEPGVCGCGVAETDSDGDGVPDCIDNCPATPNPGQVDLDGNGVGDACESGCPINQLPGDLDGDCDVDGDDRAILWSALRACDDDAAYNADADYDGDECVTFSDYRTWYSYFRSAP